jgi:hypothetical protein
MTFLVPLFEAERWQGFYCKFLYYLNIQLFISCPTYIVCRRDRTIKAKKNLAYGCCALTIKKAKKAAERQKYFLLYV